MWTLHVAFAKRWVYCNDPTLGVRWFEPEKYVLAFKKSIHIALCFVYRQKQLTNDRLHLSAM